MTHECSHKFGGIMKKNKGWNNENYWDKNGWCVTLSATPDTSREFQIAQMFTVQKMCVGLFHINNSMIIVTNQLLGEIKTHLVIFRERPALFCHWIPLIWEDIK